MKLLVDNLSETPSRQAFEVPAGWWTDRCPGRAEPGLELPSAFRFEVDSYKMGEDIYLQGDLSGEVELPCSRCLARYRHALRESFRLILEPVRDRVPLDPESADALKGDGLCLGEDPEAGWYRGSELGLDRFFAELISLALPVQPLCSEECEGLCPRCGAARGREPCDCVEQKPKSPFAVLEVLRGGGTGGNP